MAEHPDITSIENVEVAKATTEGQVDAIVEYSVEIAFTANQHSHTIKLTAYATTLQLMIQPLHEKVGLREHLGNTSLLH